MYGATRMFLVWTKDDTFFVFNLTARASQSREPRSLIRTIRKRLSFSKRSKSVERQPDSLREQSVASTDEQPLRDERARSVPGSREPSAPREMSNGTVTPEAPLTILISFSILIFSGHKQESFLSLASNTSFFAENSTLVFECTVNGEKTYFDYLDCRFWLLIISIISLFQTLHCTLLCCE